MSNFNKKMYREGKSALKEVAKTLESYYYPISGPAIVIDWDKETVVAFGCKYDAKDYCEKQYSEKNGNNLEIVLFIHHEDMKYTHTYRNAKFFKKIKGTDFYRQRNRVTFLKVTSICAEIL